MKKNGKLKLDSLTIKSFTLTTVKDILSGSGEFSESDQHPGVQLTGGSIIISVNCDLTNFNCGGGGTVPQV